MLTVTVSSKGQIAIPKEIRERLDIRAGTKLALYALRRALSSDWRQMQGAYKGPSLNAARKQERRKELLLDAKGH